MGSKNKRGLQLAISTIILLIIGILILIALVLVFTGTWQKFQDAIRGYSGSEIDNLNKLCQAQCDLGNKHSFCCEEKLLEGQKITCLDENLDLECNINCEGVCS